MEPALLVVGEYIDEEPDVVALIGGSGRAGEREPTMTEMRGTPRAF